MRIERTEAVHRLHDQMLRMKKDENQSAEKILGAAYEQLEHRAICNEKRLVKIETDIASIKVKIEHEIPRERLSVKKQLDKKLKDFVNKQESFSNSLKEKLVLVKD